MAALPRLRTRLARREVVQPNPTLADIGRMMDREAQQRVDWGPSDPCKVAAFIVRAGEKANARTPVPLPKDPVARLIVVSGMKARGEKIPDV
jgi:hypothetical protein